MGIQKPERFDIKDLSLEVRLDALVDGQSYDFTGRRYFTASFFREGIGFGITNIHIEVNTSLQPIVEITFMDLYGNTMFGGQNNTQGVDYSSFFHWPPPKFMLTFKGYLGRPVTWMLNLLKHDIKLVAATGHFEFKASFVPNQWGFFGDIPFKYLLAAKRLRMSKGQTQDEPMSIYDLIDIGRKVEIKNTEVTQKYNSLLNQMNMLYRDITNALADDQIVYFEKEINGQVDGRTVKGFQNIFIKDVTKQGSNSGISSMTDLLDFQKQDGGRTLINQFLFTKMRINGSIGTRENLTLDQFKGLPELQKNEDMARCTEIIKKNIEAINNEALAESYDVTKVQLGKITISEILRQMAKDSAYIMGRILEAGFKGYSGGKGTLRKEDGDAATTSIVGKYYPLVNSKERDGEEAPATKRHASKDYGVEDPGCEMDFVSEFISAIVDGIANDLVEDSKETTISEDRLIARISNLEAVVDSNPYKPFFSSIAENLLVRSGIAAFMTRSDDPNKPGGYAMGIASILGSSDTANNIKKLAEADATNISESIIRSMNADNIGQLSAFAKFFDSLLSDDGEDLLDSEGKNSGILDGLLSDIDEPVAGGILDYKVVTKLPGGKAPADFNTQEKIRVQQSASTPGLEVKTLRTIMAEGGFDGLRGMVDPSTLMSRKLVNNSLPYVFPVNGLPAYYILVFQGKDAAAIKSKNTAPTDSEFNGSDVDKDEEQAKGIIEVDEYSDADNNIHGRVEKFNFYVNNGYALDYSALRSAPLSEFRSRNTYGEALGDNIPGTGAMPDDLRSFLWRKEVVNTEPGDDPTKTKAGDIVYTVVHAKDETRTRLVFGPFLKGQKGRNQRVYIKTMCVEILKKIAEKEKRAQEIVSKIIGKANEQENILYKQFHTLFHQWSSMAYTDSIASDGTYNGSSIPMNGEGIANSMEALFGREPGHVSIGNMEASAIKDMPDSTFLYDYPLQRIKEMNRDGATPIDVKHAVINIDPLYKPDDNTTVLNMFYNICNKNNFMFLPIPGYAGYLDVKDVFKPYLGQVDTRVRNYFHVLFMPTPESRALISNTTFTAPTSFTDQDAQRYIKSDVIGVKYGSPDNQIVRNLSVETNNNKVTAESITMLQQLSDNEDRNKTVTKDCSMLNVIAGRSYTAKVDTIGNAQIYPMQFFFLERMPLFDGLYQIMKVEHDIRPNDMTTSFEGMRMRFDTGSGYYSIPPVTLETMQRLSDERPQPIPEAGSQNIQGDSYASSENYERNATVETADIADLRSRYQNGRLPESALTTSTFMQGGGYIGPDRSSIKYKLLGDAARSFDSMMAAFKSASFSGKQKAYVKDGYRTYQEQVALRNRLGDGAAVPGTSNHGWGVAVDFWWGMKTSFRKERDLRIASFTHPNYKWFHENAHRYGWYNPTRLRDGLGVDEWWHWEYWGQQTSPEPLLAEYAAPFDRQIVPTLRQRGASFDTSTFFG